ncbi:MAG: hypothetical protein AAF830_17320 [Pseudomonadota bacterium]
MILRSLTENVRTQNWFAVGLDFFIVVVGVFIGIQLGNWNDERSDRRDEARILRQLRDDVIAAKGLAERTAEARITVLDEAVNALDVLFDRSDREELSESECRALMATRAIVLPFTELSSFDELVSSGRLDVLRDDELRASLIQLKQVVAAADRASRQISQGQTALAVDFPEFVQTTGVVAEGTNGRREVGTIATCDTAGMKGSQAFLNTTANAVDRYDAFVRDVVTPWRAAINRVHTRLDELLEPEDTKQQP